MFDLNEALPVLSFALSLSALIVTAPALTRGRRWAVAGTLVLFLALISGLMLYRSYQAEQRVAALRKDIEAEINVVPLTLDDLHNILAEYSRPDIGSALESLRLARAIGSCITARTGTLPAHRYYYGQRVAQGAAKAGSSNPLVSDQWPVPQVCG